MGSCKANAIEVPSGDSLDESMFLSNEDYQISSSREERIWVSRGMKNTGNLIT
jgi:hypothetical protein